MNEVKGAEERLPVDINILWVGKNNFIKKTAFFILQEANWSRHARHLPRGTSRKDKRRVRRNWNEEISHKDENLTPMKNRE